MNKLVKDVHCTLASGCVTRIANEVPQLSAKRSPGKHLSGLGKHIQLPCLPGDHF